MYRFSSQESVNQACAVFPTPKVPGTPLEDTFGKGMPFQRNPSDWYGARKNSAFRQKNTYFNIKYQTFK